MGNTNERVTPHGTGNKVFPTVHAVVDQQREKGLRKYGEELTMYNNRSALLDAQSEATDLLVYLTQVLMEQEGAPIFYILKDVDGTFWNAQFDWWSEIPTLYKRPPIPSVGEVVIPVRLTFEDALDREQISDILREEEKDV